MSESTLRYTRYRIALASGILGSVGATLGWLIWLAVRMASLELLLTMLVGGALGYAVHWTQDYVRVAKREREGGTNEPATAAPPAGRRKHVAFAWAGGFAFLGLVSEHLVAHMATEFLRPFLASLASLLPAGMILGWTMHRGSAKDENGITLLVNGLVVGLVIAAVTGIIWTVGFGDAPWTALAAWWGMIGIGMKLLAGSSRNALGVGDPVFAVALVFLATLALNQLPATRSTYERLGALGTIPWMLQTMAAEIQQSPAVPATFWMDAEERYTGAKYRADSLARAKVIADRALPPPRLDLPGAVARLTGEAPDTTTTAIPGVPGARTEFVRSWLVILLFAVGLGCAPWVERSLRPIDYPNSETYRNDIMLTIAVVVMVVAACACARIGPRWP